MNQRSRTLRDCALLVGFCGFLFFFGLSYFGLIGADEPRYAQVAREMLARHDWITPTLGGTPWLEKPVLYYWQAMLFYRIFGVSDWVARLPSAFDATLMVFGVYWFLRRIQTLPVSTISGYPEYALDGALFTASAAGVIGFARAASTDMPLAGTFTLAVLAWYAWRDRGDKLSLALFYVFIAFATLAKGPVAPFLAAAVIVLFSIAIKDMRILWRSLWLPGILIFCVVVLPWYIAVQLRNPDFFHIFIVEHNLARFGTNLYRHSEPFWYYLPVAVFGLVPWIVFIVSALVECAGESFRSRTKNNQTNIAENQLNAFLSIWLVVPIIFFSVSRSKLPGYILPSLPAGTLLLGNYIRRKITNSEPVSGMAVSLHSLVATVPVVPALMIQYVLVQHRLPWTRALLISCSVALALTLAIGTMLTKWGLTMLRTATLIPVVLAVALVLRIGSPAMDRLFSARPLANDLGRIEDRFSNGPLPIAILRLTREDEYGLQFYFNQAIPRYELGEIPPQAHLVVVPREIEDRVQKRAEGRRVVHLGRFSPRALEYFWVSGR